MASAVVGLGVGGCGVDVVAADPCEAFGAGPGEGGREGCRVQRAGEGMQPRGDR